MRITNLVFDLYGTLVDIHTDENSIVWEKTALYFSYHGAHYSGVLLKRAFQDEMSRREASAGQSYECFPDIPVESVMADLFRVKGITDHADMLGLHAAHLFRISSTEYIRLYDGVTDALEKLRKHGYRLWLLSNAQHAFTAYELVHLGLGPQFDGVFLSSDYGCRKPDIRFYRALLDAHHLDPATCMMIGNDRETDIAGAQRAGLATLYMHTNLTPEHQAGADPAKAIIVPPAAGQELEYEGCNWSLLADLLCQ